MEKKLHIHIKLKDSKDAALALDCAKYMANVASNWSAGLNQLATVFVFTCPDLEDGVIAEVIADIPSLPSTSKGLSLIGQEWFEEQLALRDMQAKARADRARKAAQARWGGDE